MTGRNWFGYADKIPKIGLDAWAGWGQRRRVMKTYALLLGLVSMVLLAPISAGFGEKQLEMTKKTAAVKGKVIVFIFEQAYYDPNCPKCIAEVNANNSAMRRELPRKSACVIKIDGVETRRSVESLPQCVKDAVKDAPQLIATDAACEKVIATLDRTASRQQADDFAKAVAAAATSK